MDDYEDNQEEADLKFWEQAKEGVDYFEDREGMRHDIKERDHKYKKIIREAEEEARRNLEKQFNFRTDMLGFCHSVWDEKKRILKEKHNIDWKTPQEMNPLVNFD